ncbi:DEAD/DEAH box helicase family protein [uncultured Jatrophihabitans sp.]|uniref:DEAD/DEAH box helicase family protein n=1 Tax=uncultured Jatrophihabitans sp. TaxID=1610747 RepID=UPI0035C9BF00
MSNFAFLRPEWPALFAEAARAERNGVADPRTSCFYARRCLELAVNWLYDADVALVKPYRDDLSAMLFEPSLRALVGNDIQAKMDLIRSQGNGAVHKTRPVTTSESIPTLGQLFQVLFWIASRYSRDPNNVPDAGLRFDAALIPRPVPAEVRLKRQAELQEQERRLHEQDEQLERERERSESLEAELVALRAQVVVAKAVNEARPDDHDYDEATTRDLYIDVMLKEAGWALDRREDREFEVSGMPNNQGKGFVDYVLWGDDGKPLGLVEAKRTRRDATVGQQQAKLYADCLQARFGQRPVIFYTNGYETFLWDDTTYPPRQVQGFYTKDELALLVQRRTTRRVLAELPINAEIVERHYQHRAIRRIGEAFETGNQRQALVVMATGAGKTRTVIALVDLLMRANWAKRVLFLADRVALVNQAVNAFKAHLPEASPVNLVTEKTTDGRVYISTYPTMMGLINEGAGDERRFGPGYFDLVIIDEAHRSVYQKYGAIFSWFDSLLVGLTATPKDEIDRNTYRLFHLEDGVPTDAYPLDEAVTEGYLVPPRAVSVPLKFPREGIKYDDLTDEEKDEWDARDWDEDGDVPDLVVSDAVNKWLFNADTVDKMLATLMTTGHKVAGGDRLGKTIIFARNNAHAEFIRDRFDANYPEYAGAFARVVTYKTEYAQTLINDFLIKDKAPHIAISVDMLDTGIDVPEVVNLVFFKPVRSKTKFWQMLGRGTRLCPDLYGPGDHKTDFYIFDFCGNLEFFNTDPAAADGRLAESLAQRLFKARLELITGIDHTLPQDVAAVETADGTTSEIALRRDVAYSLHDIVVGMNVDNFVVRPKRRWVEIYEDLDRWENLTRPEAGEAAEHLSGLPSTVRDDDEQAKRFDLLILRLQLAVLNAEPSFDRLRDQVREIASALLEVTNIPAVREQQELLDEIAGEDWWVDVTLPMLELVRRRIRLLVRLIDKARRLIVYTDFVDQLGEATEITLSGLPVGTDMQRFHAKVRVYLRAHEDHVALQKLRRALPLTATDLDELQRMLAESGLAQQADLDAAVQQAKGLGLFVRRLVGLDRDAAAEALSTFIKGRTLTASQLDFVNLIVTYLTENGVMEAGQLYESPFTGLAPLGPESLFTSDEIDVLVAALDQVRASASSDVA